MSKESTGYKCKACLHFIDRTKAEVYSRIVGYVRPISDANDGKKEEIKDRKMFKWENTDGQA